LFLSRAALFFFLIRLISPADAFSATPSVSPTTAEAVQVEVYESSADLQKALHQEPSLNFGSYTSASFVINVNDAVTYQQMDGFGASLTDTSAWLIHHKLTNAQRADLMGKLFDPVKGIGLSFLRQPMGASDFALHDYSYDDMPPGQSDPELTRFSIDHDRADVIPVLQQAMRLNPQLKIMATAWSPPGWMKTSDSLIQGKLLKSSYAALAAYFVKFVQAYESSGIPIHAVSMQNEPLFTPRDYPGMAVTADEQASFIRDSLGPAFLEAGIRSKILIFDHNWDLMNFPITVLRDPKAASFVAGTATHCYGGVVTAQNDLHNQFPNKEIWETECSGGRWQPNNLLQQQTELVIDVTRNWSKTVVLWNLALDQDNGPHTGGCATCRGVATVNTTTSPTTISTTVDYAALGHVSKFVSPGAFRIESNSFGKGSLEDVAFRNPDGSIVLIALNSSSAPLNFDVHWSQQYFAYSLKPGSTATFIWRELKRGGQA
jgi:glucosylceramidase